MLDYGRKMDLEDVAKAIDTARTTTERERYEKLAYRIAHESAPIQSLRDRMLKAFHARDMITVHKIREHIQNVRLNETYGKSWGNNSGQRIVK